MSDNGPDGPVDICVIGLGPRGLSVLERLCANASAPLTDGGLRIHLIDPQVLTGSRVWRVNQAPELLMNTVSAQVTMFPDESVRCTGPIVTGPSLYEWAQAIKQGDGIDNPPDRIRQEADLLGPNSYPSRAFYGQYLAWVLRFLIGSSPANVTIHLHPQQAVDLANAEDGTQTVTLSNGQRLCDANAIVLTQGHVGISPTNAEDDLSDYADRNNLDYVPPGNPAEADLDGLASGQPTALRGLGLNFFDYMALLTEGRGGSFTDNGSGHLTYHRSGREPHLVAGSGRGLPYHARGDNQKGAYGRHTPLFLTEDVIAELRARADHNAPVDFKSDVWPLVDREVRAVYYATIIAQRSNSPDAERFLRDYVALHAGADGSGVCHADPLAYVTSDAERALLKHFEVSEEERWDWLRIARPYTNQELNTHEDFHSWLVSYLDNDVREAHQGNVDSPVKAALDVMRDMRNEIRLVVDHGGVSGDSYRDDLQAWYTPLNAFVSIGPPPRRIEEMIALIDSGVLSILGPDMTVTRPPDGRGFLVDSASLTGSAFSATALIEARMPNPDIRRTSDPLISGMLARGECGLYRIPIRGGGRYETGGLAVTRRPYHLLDASGRAHPRRFAFGVPTEAVHWATAAGIRPGVDSVILGDADAVARASLLAASRQVSHPATIGGTPITKPNGGTRHDTAQRGSRSAVARPGSPPVNSTSARPPVRSSEPVRRIVEG